MCCVPIPVIMSYVIKGLHSNPFTLNILEKQLNMAPGCIAQSITRLATDASLTAVPGVASLIPAQSHTFVEIDRDMESRERPASGASDRSFASFSLSHSRRVAVSYK